MKSELSKAATMSLLLVVVLIPNLGYLATAGVVERNAEAVEAVALEFERNYGVVVPEDKKVQLAAIMSKPENEQTDDDILFLDDLLDSEGDLDENYTGETGQWGNGRLNIDSVLAAANKAIEAGLVPENYDAYAQGLVTMGKKQWGPSCTQYVATAVLETGILKATIDSSQPINTHPELDLAESFLAECGRVLRGSPHFVMTMNLRFIKRMAGTLPSQHDWEVRYTRNCSRAMADMENWSVPKARLTGYGIILKDQLNWDILRYLVYTYGSVGALTHQNHVATVYGYGTNDAGERFFLIKDTLRYGWREDKGGVFRNRTSSEFIMESGIVFAQVSKGEETDSDDLCPMDWYTGKVVPGFQKFVFADGIGDKAKKYVKLDAWCTADRKCRCPDELGADQTCCDLFKKHMTTEDIAKANCGKNSASSCSACYALKPTDKKGKSWCNTDCVFDKKTKTCQKKGWYDASKTWCDMTTWYFGEYTAADNENFKITGTQAVPCTVYYTAHLELTSDEAKEICEQPDNVGRTFRVPKEITAKCLKAKNGRSQDPTCQCPADHGEKTCCDYFKKEMDHQNGICHMGWYGDGTLEYDNYFDAYTKTYGTAKLTEVEELTCQGYYDRIGQIGSLSKCDYPWMDGKKYYGPVDPSKPVMEVKCGNNVCTCDTDSLNEDKAKDCCSYLKEKVSPKQYDTCADMTWFGEKINEGVQELNKNMEEVFCTKYYEGQKNSKPVCKNQLASKKFYQPTPMTKTKSVRTSCINNECKCMTDDYLEWKEANEQGGCCDFLKATLEEKA